MGWANADCRVHNLKSVGQRKCYLQQRLDRVVSQVTVWGKSDSGMENIPCNYSEVYGRNQGGQDG